MSVELAGPLILAAISGGGLFLIAKRLEEKRAQILESIAASEAEAQTSESPDDVLKEATLREIRSDLKTLSERVTAIEGASESPQAPISLGEQTPSLFDRTYGVAIPNRRRKLGDIDLLDPKAADNLSIPGIDLSKVKTSTSD